MLIKANNITIETLCNEINLNKSTYQMMRHRNILPRLDTLIAMAKALNVSLDYLAYGFEKDRDLGPAKQKLEDAIQLINQVKNDL